MKMLVVKCYTAEEVSKIGVKKSRVLASLSLEVYDNFMLTEALKASLTDTLTNLATQYSAVEGEIYSCSFEII